MNGVSITQYDNFAWMPMVMSAVGNKTGSASGEAAGEKKSGGFDWMSMLGSKPADPAVAQAQAAADAAEAQSKAARFAGLFDFLKSKNQPATAAGKWSALFQKENTVKIIAVAVAALALMLLLFFLLRKPKTPAP